MVTILPALRQVREDLVKFLDRSTVERLCKQLGHRWRDRHLDPYTTLHLFILQVLNQKITLGLDQLKGRSVDVVKKELLVFALVYNLVWVVILQAAGDVPPGGSHLRTRPNVDPADADALQVSFEVHSPFSA